MKRLITIVCTLSFIFSVTSCNNEQSGDNETMDYDTIVSIFTATILEIYDEPHEDWYFDPIDVTILVMAEGYGEMVFDYRRLEDIGATVGDIVELTIVGSWEELSPAAVYPYSWRLVE